MAGFGGAVKLTGESEYRTALKNITQNLREVSSQLQLNTERYNANDKSVKNTAQAQEALNKIYKAQETEVAKLRSTYTSFAQKVQDQAKAHGDLENKYKQEKAELERIGKELGTTSKEYQQQKEKVDNLEKSLAKSRQENENNQRALSRMGTALNKAETDLVKTAKQMDNLGKESEETGKKMEKAGEGFTVFKGIVSNLATKAITGAINAMKNLASITIDIGKQALQSYAEYEQLVGGVETLFKDSAKEVQNYANNAYKTAGLSANQYMETVTSFSASLLQGLNGDTAKTAKIADMAITDMADNANKMGTSMEMIQNAYQGFAKQNYTMLDNLKLGYGGTKTEMVRLINDSKILNHEIKNLDDITFDQIIEAIHVVQTNIGITGTTAKEAEKTIQGSVASMKSAWQNLLTGIADDNQDFGKLVDNFVDSVITAGENIVPRVKKIVEGVKKLIGSLVTQVFPKLKKEIPELKPIIEVFEWFIKNKDKVVNAVKLMVTAFAVNKIAQFTKSLTGLNTFIVELTASTLASKTATDLDTASQGANTLAKTAGVGATNLLTASTKALNAVWESNPIGLVITAVVALIAIMNKLNEKNKELLETEKANLDAIKQETQKVKDAKASYEELAQAKQDSINVGMTELSNYQELYRELETLVDENGQVKEGYEQRASFITSTLKDALGIEIEYTDGVIQNYGELRDSIQQVIDKKKAQIILDSQQEQYTEAINNQGEAVRTLTDLEKQLATEKGRKAEIDQAIIDAQNSYNDMLQVGGIISARMAKKDLETAQERKIAYEQGVRDLESSISQQKQLIGQYAYDVNQYETNMALAHEGNYDQMSTVTWNYVKDFSTATDAEKAMLQDKVNNTQKTIDVLKEVRTEANATEIDAEIAKNERLLTEQQKALDDYLAQTTSTLNDVELEWSDSLDDQLSEITGSKVEFKDAGNGQVQAYVDGVKVGEPKSKEEMAKMTTEAINEISKQETGATTAGENFIAGINRGITNREGTVFATVRDFGSRLLSNLKASLKEQSPSKATKQMGQYLLEGLGLGIKSEQKGILSQVANLGKSIISTFDDSITSDAISSNLSAQIQSGIPTINSQINTSAIQQANTQDNNYNTMLLAFQDALASMKIELDDEEAGRFVRRTVENAIYT